VNILTFNIEIQLLNPGGHFH